MAGHDRDDEVHQVTSASPRRSAELAAKERRYLISMAIRTICVILLFVVPGPARWIFLPAAVFLPYIAVVFANDPGRPKGPSPFGHDNVKEIDSPDSSQD